MTRIAQDDVMPSPSMSTKAQSRAEARVIFVLNAANEVMSAHQGTGWLDQSNPILDGKTPRQVAFASTSGIIYCECALGLRRIPDGRRIYPHLGDKSELPHRPGFSHPLLRSGRL